MSQPVRLRMLDKLTGVVAELARVDETLIDQHGHGVIDGFSHSFLIQNKRSNNLLVRVVCSVEPWGWTVGRTMLIYGFCFHKRNCTSIMGKYHGYTTFLGSFVAKHQHIMYNNPNSRVYY